jgi:plasmid stabilization system protein ParE
LKDGRVIEVNIHPEAEVEYEAALTWYFDRSPKAAERFESAFDEAIEAIRSSPNMFPMCDKHHRLVMSKRYPYSVIYRLVSNSAQVIALVHSKRRLRYWSDRT